MKEFASWLVHSLVGVCPEEVALSLQQIRKGGSWNSILDCVHKRSAPAILILIHRRREEAIHEEVLKVRMMIERILNVSEKGRTNDASPGPHQCDAAHIQFPAKLLFGGTILMQVTDTSYV